jgi:hypothetical protein
VGPFLFRAAAFLDPPQKGNRAPKLQLFIRRELLSRPDDVHHSTILLALVSAAGEPTEVINVLVEAVGRWGDFLIEKS